MRALSVLYLAIDELDPRRRGEAYGRAVADRLPAIWAAYSGIFESYGLVDPARVREVGPETLEVTKAWRPHLLAEMEGVAAGSGVPVEVIGALNARTEILAGRECSTVARTTEPEGPWLAQNWDWFLDAPERCVVLATPEYTTFTEAGILGKIGVNRAGLAVSLDILRHTSDRTSPLGVPVHLLLREILGACESLQDVADLLAASPTSASSCITIITAAGEGAVFEVTPQAVAQIGPDDDGFLSHTNNFCDAALAPGDKVVPEGRHGDLIASRPKTLDDARRALASHATTPSVCVHETIKPGLPPAGTAASILMDPVARRMWVAAGPPCTTEFEEIPSLA